MVRGPTWLTMACEHPCCTQDTSLQEVGGPEGRGSPPNLDWGHRDWGGGGALRRLINGLALEGALSISPGLRVLRTWDHHEPPRQLQVFYSR